MERDEVRLAEPCVTHADRHDTPVLSWPWSSYGDTIKCVDKTELGLWITILNYSLKLILNKDIIVNDTNQM